MSAPDYFRQQIAQAFGEQPVLASGYFRSTVAPAGAAGSLLGDAGAMVELGQLLSAGAKARGYYLALTEDKLWVVVTRAPATKTPLLENLAVLPVPRALVAVRMDDDKLVVVVGELELVLDLWLDNPAFPAQGRLIEMLSEAFGSGVSLATLRRQQRSRRMPRIAFAVALAGAGVAVAAAVNTFH